MKHAIVTFPEFSAYFVHIAELELSYFSSHDFKLLIEIVLPHEVSHPLTEAVDIFSNILL